MQLYGVKPESLYAQFMQYLTGVRGKLDQLLKHNDFLKTIITATFEGREKRNQIREHLKRLNAGVEVGALYFLCISTQST